MVQVFVIIILSTNMIKQVQHVVINLWQGYSEMLFLKPERAFLSFSKKKGSKNPHLIASKPSDGDYLSIKNESSEHSRLRIPRNFSDQCHPRHRMPINFSKSSYLRDRLLGNFHKQDHLKARFPPNFSKEDDSTPRLEENVDK